MPVNAFVNYLRVHDRVRVAFLAIGLLSASFAACGGITLYLSVRPEEGTTFTRARYLITALVLCSALLNMGIAWLLGCSHRVPRFAFRLLLSIGTTLVGATCLFVGTALIDHWTR